MKKVSLKQLFLQMFTISAFTFGGGFVIVTLMKKRLVEQQHWLEESDMLDMTALAQSAPGPIAVNTAVQLGWHLGGFGGMLAAVGGCVLPPLIVLSVISVFYTAFIGNPVVALFLRGMQAGVAAVILDVTLSLGEKVVKSRSLLRLCLMGCALVLTLGFHVNPVLLLLGAALVGVADGMRKGAKA